ncbi:tetratricopeptide repeat protein [Chrysiogenes arsenatis]|uniref:tetratricopeptide repeat protein n=1 Tax=Chrysiogenes arsenatis TaxID=309797 RepID=UPI000417E149|nr:tetratricopeptide repeat protein [Chrysiogenes arsenatis]
MTLHAMTRLTMVLLLAATLQGCMVPFGEGQTVDQQRQQVLNETAPVGVQLEHLRMDNANLHALNQALARDLMALRQQVNNNTVNLDYLRNVLGTMQSEMQGAPSASSRSTSTQTSRPAPSAAPSKSVPPATAAVKPAAPLPSAGVRPPAITSPSSTPLSPSSPTSATDTGLPSALSPEGTTADKAMLPNEAPITTPSRDTFSDMSGEPTALYNQALTYYRANDPQRALIAFDQVYRNFPQSSLADNSLYWAGEIYYAQKDYTTAYDYFDKVTRNYPTGNKVSDSYLKKGYSLEMMGKRSEAIDILMYTVDSFAGTPSATLARKKLEELAAQ